MDAPVDRKQISEVQCPNIAGLNGDTVRMLHDSLVGIVLMRRSIESANVAISRSIKVETQSRELLERLEHQGL
jgi:hypothetical protein